MFSQRSSLINPQLVLDPDLFPVSKAKCSKLLGWNPSLFFKTNKQTALYCLLPPFTSTHSFQVLYWRGKVKSFRSFGPNSTCMAPSWLGAPFLLPNLNCSYVVYPTLCPLLHPESFIITTSAKQNYIASCGMQRKLIKRRLQAELRQNINLRLIGLNKIKWRREDWKLQLYHIIWYRCFEWVSLS
jgi:hypothetical protein